ncbi:MAG: hypothetical protein KGK08_14995, partial [Acidobacteriota bacterium]|nr:hypothetical protein [Acidobacteriota bacterium]
MPRPVDNVGAQPSGFGPTETPKTSLGVFESLNATGAPSQAAGLAAALNVADQRMQRPAMYAEMAQGSAGVSQGESAAAFGNVDPAMEAKVAGYQQGVQRVTAQKQLLAWIDDTKSKLNLPMAQGGYADAPLHNGVDADGKTTPGLPQM